MVLEISLISVYDCLSSVSDRQVDRQAGGQTGRQRGRQTNGEMSAVTSPPLLVEVKMSQMKMDFM